MSDTADVRLQSATLVLGGARSGKSRHAEALVAAHAGADAAMIYVATATACDAEMAQRIAQHRARRGARWTTVEAPIELAAALQAHAAAPVLVDCLTLWLSNLMLAERDIDTATTDLLQTLTHRLGPVVLVSNE
ncbi:MAG: bifunctional adenosylcobinamide kinase/adenosylcobinamide-phosphate guanylyltransferase, partial [Alphaproteobacteria bacterium]|nr:bifunctional adenosylcobinamide kinase/adenosylcobinamide-phosphate guanylyltransferase [Alphaproteobacteria bacterium]